MKLRDSFHIFIGFAIMYAIGCLTEFSTYTLSGKIVGVPIASIGIGLSIGGFWEWLQEILSKGEIIFDWNDVFRTAIGTFIGGIFSLFVVSQTIIIFTCIVSLLLIVNDFRYLFKK